MNKVYCCYPGGKHKALTMSYDDGREEDRRLIDIFNHSGLRGTFHLNSGLWTKDEQRIKPAEIRTLYEGHEVACHTSTHPTIARCPLPEVIEEVLADRRALEDITGYAVRGMSYPNGSYSEEIKRAFELCGIRYSRVVETTGGFALPSDPYEWRGTCHHNHELLRLGEAFLDLKKQHYLYLMYVWGHSYEFTLKDNWALMEDFCSLMGGQEDIWYCTNIELMDCLDAFKRLRFSADNSFVENPSVCDCWLRVNDGAPIVVRGGERLAL